MENESKQMWGGCFTQKTASSLMELNSSIDIDKRLYKEDIFASQLYAKALWKAGVINKDDFDEIWKGLDKVREEWEKGVINITIDDEDIHSLNERRLKEIIGSAADRLHTGRSRNDQVATDVRLWLSNNGECLKQLLNETIKIMVDLAKREIDVLMPGYTHLKRAQPVRFSHFILSHAWSFQSDVNLLITILDRTKVLPLGSGALAGNPFPINRNELAKEMNFKGVTMNSMNAVGNRDFIAEFLFWASLCGTHLSRLSEDLILFNTEEFNFVKVSQQYSTGSSLMPQKRNPDSLELIRGASGKLIGNSTAFMVTLKSLPSTYNKDLQCDKQILFESYDLLTKVLKVLNGTLETLEVNSENCKKALKPDQLATRLAHFLVKKGLPFRQAHNVAGKAVALAEERNKPLNMLTEVERTNLCVLLSGDLTELWDYEKAVEEHDTIGGTSKKSVMDQISTLESWIKLM